MGRLAQLFVRTVDRIGPGRLLIALGVVLLLNPLYIGALHLDEPEWYRYDAAEVRFENGTVTGPGATSVADDDVACLGEAYRNCMLEYHVFDADDVAIPSRVFPARNDGYGHNYAFVYGQFYRTQLEERNGTRYLTLEPIEREKALSYASTRLSDAPGVARRAVEGGTVTTREPVPFAGELIQDRKTGRFYVLYRQASHSLGSKTFEQAVTEGRFLEIVSMVLLGAFGLAAILRGQRIRIEW